MASKITKQIPPFNELVRLGVAVDIMDTRKQDMFYLTTQKCLRIPERACKKKKQKWR